jgi:hypothetical protein
MTLLDRFIVGAFVGLLCYGSFSAIDALHNTRETLRLLKRGDKVDCRMSDMRGTTP